MTQAAIVQPKKVLRVLEVTQYIKNLLERDSLLSLIQVQGEVTNLSISGSGWVYFTLKDATSQIACVITRNNSPSLRDQIGVIRNGSVVLVEASVTVYDGRGVYQLSVRRMKVGGEGAAKLRFLKLQEKLEQEGMFSAGRKRQLPAYPREIALITAPNSQAYHDVIRRLHVQWPHVGVIFAPVNVQGEQAAGQICTALDICNRMTDAEIILIVRGGGSPEELEAFNDERLARAIFASRIPVVTGIGHTQDTSIADLVADVAATTPTAAASAVVPNGEAMVSQCRQVYGSARSHMNRGLRVRRQNVARLNQELIRLSPLNRIVTRRQRLDEAWEFIDKAIATDLRHRRRTLEALRSHLDALNPTAILSRGYALLADAETGEVVSSTAAATPGRRVEAQVKDGKFVMTVAPS
jgi:exodeoxyribonuclease VII large subunit